MNIEVISSDYIYDFLKEKITNEVMILNSDLQPARKYQCNKDSGSSISFNWRCEMDNYFIWSAFSIRDDEVITYHHMLGGIPDGVSGHRVVGNVFYCMEKDLIILETVVIGDDVRWYMPAFSLDDEKITAFVKNKMVIQLIK